MQNQTVFFSNTMCIKTLNIIQIGDEQKTLFNVHNKLTE